MSKEWFQDFSRTLIAHPTTNPNRTPSVLFFKILNPDRSFSLHVLDGQVPSQPLSVYKIDSSSASSIVNTDHTKICTLEYASELVFTNLIHKHRSLKMAFLTGEAKITGDTHVLKTLGKYLKYAIVKDKTYKESSEKSSKV